MAYLSTNALLPYLPHQWGYSVLKHQGQTWFPAGFPGGSHDNRVRTRPTTATVEPVRGPRCIPDSTDKEDQAASFQTPRSSYGFSGVPDGCMATHASDRTRTSTPSSRGSCDGYS